MMSLPGLHRLVLGLSLACAFALPVSAQQRIQIGDLVQRIDRLESEVTRLRVGSGGGGGADFARLDQIEQELRRLTGIIERLEYESRRATAASKDRLDGFEERLDAVESARSVAGPVAAPAPAAVAGSGFPLPETSGTITPTPYQPQASFQPLPDFVAPQTPSVQRNPDAIYDEGLRLLNVGQFDQAGAQFEDLIASYPQDPKAGQAQFWLGDMHFKLGRYEQAASAFLDSFRNWPEGAKAPDSLLKLGMTLANIGKTEEACLSFRQVAARYPSAPPTLLRRADIESQRYRCS